MTTPIQRRCRVLAAVATAGTISAAAQGQVLHYQGTYDVGTPTGPIGTFTAAEVDNWTATADYFLDLGAVDDPVPINDFDPTTSNNILSGTITFFDNSGSVITSYEFENEGISIEDADPTNPFGGSLVFDGSSTNIDTFTSIQGLDLFGTFGHAFELPDDTFDSPAVSEEKFDTIFLDSNTTLWAIEPTAAGEDFTTLITTSIVKIPDPSQDFDLNNDLALNFKDAIAYLDLFDAVTGPDATEPVPADTPEAQQVDRLGNQDELVSDADLIPFIEGLENAAPQTP